MAEPSFVGVEEPGVQSHEPVKFALETGAPLLTTRAETIAVSPGRTTLEACASKVTAEVDVVGEVANVKVDVPLEYPVRPPANTVYVPVTQSAPAAVNGGTENAPAVTVAGSRKTTPDGPVTCTISSGVPAGAGDAVPVIVIVCPVV